MRYPKDVQEFVDQLKEYKENDELTEFNLFHLYPDGLCYPKGYYDSQWFKLVGYNFETKECRHLGKHDGLRFIGKKTRVDITRIFADGSTLIRMTDVCVVTLFQEVSVCSKKYL